MKKSGKKVIKKEKRRQSIRTKLIAAFLVPIVLIIALGVAAYQTSADGIKNSYEDSTISTMTSITNYLEFGFEMVASKAKLLNSTTSLKEYYDGIYKNDEMTEMTKFREAQEVVNTNIMSEAYISAIYIFADYGRGIASTGSLPDNFYKTYLDSEEIKTFCESGYSDGWMGIHPVLDTTSKMKENKYALSYIRTLTNSMNKVKGYIILDVPMDFVLKSLEESALPEGSMMEFVTADGRILTTGEASEDFLLTEQDYYLNAINDKTTQEGSSYVSIKGKEYLFIYQKEEKAGGILCAMIPKSVITKQADEVKLITQVFVVIAVIIAILLGMFLSTSITNTLKRMIKVLSKTASGDLTGKVSIKRRDEFFTLAENINFMIENMKKLIHQTNETSTDVSKSSGDVANSSAILISSTEHIVNAIGDIEAGVERQAEDSEACLNKIVDLSEQITGIVEGVESMNESAQDSKQKADEGAKIVKELNEKVRTSTDITKEIVQDIGELNNETMEIHKFVNAINEISEETKLLSLNAAIEAASAVENGRGFAVVADQIGKLAYHSAEASKEIEGIIGKLRNRMTNTSQAALKAQEIVESQEGVLLNTVNLFMNINESIEDLSKKLENILNGADHMSEAQHVALDAIESITATSEETAAAASQLSEAADSQNQLISSLQRAMDHLNTEAKNLVEAVSVFKVE